VGLVVVAGVVSCVLEQDSSDTIIDDVMIIFFMVGAKISL
jgi:hypothetical protein